MALTESVSSNIRTSSNVSFYIKPPPSPTLEAPVVFLLSLLDFKRIVRAFSGWCAAKVLRASRSAAVAVLYLALLIPFLFARASFRKFRVTSI